MAVASKYRNEKDRQHIAVIGDGAMTGGQAFEAMNHAGVSNTNLLIILNDNCMSIDPNVGALKDYLTDITTSQTYNKVKRDMWKVLGKMSTFGKNAREVASKVEGSVKSLILQQSNLFESLKLRYFGPVDGHDVDHLIHLLNDLKNIPGPKILHCITTKGKGFSLAEKDQTKWHAPGKFDKLTGVIRQKDEILPQPPKYQVVFGETLVELARANNKIMGVTPAMPSGSSMNLMMKEMPDRAFDVGIAEQHAVTFSAGLATQGIIPFCNIYSSFMQRAFDQVIHDVAIQKLPVVFCLDRAGLVGEDGPTHHGAYDIAYMRSIPNMVIAAPMNEVELRNMMYTAQLPGHGPFTIRYPRAQGVLTEWRLPFETLDIGKGRRLVDGQELAILSIGHTGNHVTEALDILNTQEMYPAHYDLRFVKPLDKELLHEVFGKFGKILTVEDGCLPGGFGSAVLEFMADHQYSAKVVRLGIPDRIVEHGSPEQLHQACGFDTRGIVNAVALLYEQELVKVRISL
jgi:1-deoxy-D-xylulose-5-phosphate synthase